MINNYLKLLICLFILTGFSSCYKVGNQIEPTIGYAATERYLKQLPPAFPNLSEKEENQPWGKEYVIAQHFAQELDLYRAITTFKRAEYLLPVGHETRLLEIQYQILLSYYLGKRYQDALVFYQRSHLRLVTSSFPVYHDLLLILYESYLQEGNLDQAAYILHSLKTHFPETAKKLELSTALSTGRLAFLEKETAHDPAISHLLDHYNSNKKNVSKAQTLNAILPGSGYLYVGQKQSAITSFLLNALFIAAAYHFFQKNHIAAGVIVTSFETGWYFGGIYGAGAAAKLYNERLFEKQAYPILKEKNLFPVLMLLYGF